MDRLRPTANEVAVKDGRILWIGGQAQSKSRQLSHVKLIDCRGGSLLPGFNDAHIHLLSCATSRLAVDCRPNTVASIQDIKVQIGECAARTQQGEWIRAWGYDETTLGERRHPTRKDLDEATPRHPVRLDHRSGHACVLNSLALQRVGIGESYSEPVGTTIGRELDTGKPSGLLLEMQGYLDGKTGTHTEDEIESALEDVAGELLAQGVTSVQDATQYNSVSRWDFFTRFRKRVRSVPRTVLMPGYWHVPDFMERGLTYGSGSLSQSVGHVKIMVTMSSGQMVPCMSELTEMVHECAANGFPVAIHAVEAEVVESAAEAISSVSDLGGVQGLHRIEHCSECPPDVLNALARSSARVVTQPEFILQSGDRYLSTVDEAMLPYLYRIGTLMKSEIPLAFGSDAPIGDFNPMLGISSATTRRSKSGRVLSREERIGIIASLEAYTSEAARAAGLQDHIGMIKPGMPADLVLFGEDITLSPPEKLGALQPAATILGGEVVSENQVSLLNSPIR